MFNKIIIGGEATNLCFAKHCLILKNRKVSARLILCYSYITFLFPSFCFVLTKSKFCFFIFCCCAKMPPFSQNGGFFAEKLRVRKKIKKNEDVKLTNLSYSYLIYQAVITSFSSRHKLVTIHISRDFT